VSYAPHLLPKIRSDAVLDFIGGKVNGVKVQPCFPCCARISSFIPGHSCASRETVVGCHTWGFGKGIATKTSDFPCIAGCVHCHDLLDMRDKRIFWIQEQFPIPLARRLIEAVHETTSLLVSAGLVQIKGAELK
jgi:hypothetical protein